METFENTAASLNIPPRLSILIPYYQDNPVELLQALLATENQKFDIEILLYDDGTADSTINKNLQKIANTANISIRLFFAKNNKGRSTARNILTKNAKSEWVLFLDADMLPQSPGFITKYLEEVSKNTADVIFGGFCVQNSKLSNATELHRVFSQTSDCLSADERAKNGPQYVCSSNLCVRKSVLKTHGFDTSFTGWGWEDSEWAARIAKSFTIVHADIPALHLGLESTETLLARFKNSGKNYVKFTNAHPELAKTLTLYKLSHRLKTMPSQKMMRPLLSAIVRASILPTRFRILALKLWRASWYAEAYP